MLIAISRRSSFSLAEREIKSIQGTAQSYLKITLGLRALIDHTKHHFIHRGFALEKFYRPIRGKWVQGKVAWRKEPRKRGGCRAGGQTLRPQTLDAKCLGLNPGCSNTHYLNNLTPMTWSPGASDSPSANGNNNSTYHRRTLGRLNQRLLLVCARRSGQSLAEKRLTKT